MNDAEAALLALMNADVPFVEKAERAQTTSILQHELVCERCAQVFISAIHKRFCSSACRNKSPNGGRISEIICQRCGTKTPRKGARHKYCRACCGR